MATLAADTPRVFEAGPDPLWNDLPVIAADIIYEGAAVGDNASGYMRPLVAADPFRGFAEKKADNSAAGASAGDIDVHLRTRGRVKLSVAGASAVTDVGSPVYASDDDTFTLTKTGNTYIGTVVRWVTGTTCIVDFDASKGRSAKIADPASGSTVDTEARAAIDSIIDALEKYGVIHGQ